MDYREAGEDLRRRREARTWSRERLEELSGVSASAISNYERGERNRGPNTPQRFKLRQIADAFGYPEGCDILRAFGEVEAADQFEQEALSGPDELADLTSEQQETVREINRLILSLVTDRI